VQICKGCIILVRTDVCRSRIDPRTFQLGLTVEVSLLADKRKGPQEHSRDRVSPGGPLLEWYTRRLRTFVESDSLVDVPEDWVRHARRAFYTRDVKPICVVDMVCQLPSHE